MANDIVNAALEQYKKEFTINQDGKGFVSLRGLARLSGVKYQNWGQGDSIFTSKIDAMLTEQGFESDSIKTEKGIPDTVATIQKKVKLKAFGFF